jgi:hypothetical protein
VGFKRHIRQGLLSRVHRRGAGGRGASGLERGGGGVLGALDLLPGGLQVGGGWIRIKIGCWRRLDTVAGGLVFWIRGRGSDIKACSPVVQHQSKPDLTRPGASCDAWEAISESPPSPPADPPSPRCICGCGMATRLIWIARPFFGGGCASCCSAACCCSPSAARAAVASAAARAAAAAARGRFGPLGFQPVRSRHLASAAAPRASRAASRSAALAASWSAAWRFISATCSFVAAKMDCSWVVGPAQTSADRR